MMELDLHPFDPGHAATVASWVPTDRDLLWLAPRTPPPLTPQKVAAWSGDRNTPLMVMPAGQRKPCGYGEINRMKKTPAHLWLGHIVIDPRKRGRGIGSCFVRLLLNEAFAVCGADTVSLIVFPKNEPAVKCYVRCDFVLGGQEVHHFSRGGSKHRMLRLDLSRDRWLKRRADNKAQSLPQAGPISPMPQ